VALLVDAFVDDLVVLGLVEVVFDGLLAVSEHAFDALGNQVTHGDALLLGVVQHVLSNQLDDLALVLS
jgi:hypothetical protein